MEKITKLFIYIVGFSGSGKLSTAVELSHMINASIVSSSFPYNFHINKFYNNIFQHNEEIESNIMQIMLKVVEIYPKKSKNYIFFSELTKNDMRMYNELVNLSIKMKTRILPVVLKCSTSILYNRLESKKRSGYRKFNFYNDFEEKLKNKDLFIPPNSLEIENSSMSIQEVAKEIINQAINLTKEIYTT